MFLKLLTLKTEGAKMSCKCDTINIVNDNNVVIVSHADGRDGKSAYLQAVEGGYTGTEQEFNCSLSLLADVAEGKKQIAEAINTKGGSTSADSSFSKLAEDIQTLPYAGISAEGIVQDAPFSFLDYCCNVRFENITEINDNTIKNLSTSYKFFGFQAPIKFNALESITGKYAFAYCSSKSIYLPALKTILESHCFANSKFEEIIMSNIEIVDSSQFVNGTSSLKNIVFGKLTIISSMVGTGLTLSNITIGQGTDIDLPFNNWKATYVINVGQSGIDELNSNLYNNLLTKLYDHSTDGQTRTLRLGWLAHVTQKNIDYANSKGWTLTT